jgi:hypothetical protein
MPMLVENPHCLCQFVPRCGIGNFASTNRLGKPSEKNGEGAVSCSV